MVQSTIYDLESLSPLVIVEMAADLVCIFHDNIYTVQYK